MKTCKSNRSSGRPSARRVPWACAVVCACAAGTAAGADTVTLNPTADAFVAAALPSSNFGGGGALALAAPGLFFGEFQSVLRFDSSSAVAQFNASYGAGNWVIQSVVLRLWADDPVNEIFNSTAPGLFAVSWMSNDSWVEGTGTPITPSADGITFADLPSFLSGSDTAVGTFAFSGANGATNYTLQLAPQFRSDIEAGGAVGLRMFAADAEIAYLCHSRSHFQSSTQPRLLITATPEPGTATGVMLLGLAAARRRWR